MDDDINVHGCRALISAIIYLAYTDAINVIAAHRESALNFLNTKNKLFCVYCHLINLDPECVAKKLQYSIKSCGQIKK